MSTDEAVVLPTAMAPMVAVKILQPNNGAEPAGYWGMSSSIYAKELFHIEADKESHVSAVKGKVAAVAGVSGKLRVILFGKELDDERTLGSYGLGNIEVVAIFWDTTRRRFLLPR